MPVIQLKYSGPQVAAEIDDECIKAEVADVGLSDSTCGNGNSDLYKALIALINGQPLPTSSSSSTFGATVWVQDLVGNGYDAVIAKGTLTVENQVTTSPTDLFNISPAKIVDGVFDLEKDTGWIIDHLWTVSWSGTVWNIDSNGSVVTVAHPTLKKEGKKIKLTPPAGVYGCLSIKYELTRDKLSVANDGGGETTGDPYSTSITFDVDGCDDEVVLSLPAPSCLAENLGNALGILDDGDSDGDVKVEDPPPTEDPVDTERRYRYCDKKFISASPRTAGEGYEDTCLGIACGACGDDDEE